MNSTERRRIFEQTAREDLLFDEDTWTITRLQGFSNSTKVVENGFLLGDANFNTIADGFEGVLILCTLRLTPEDEIYYAVYVRSEIDNLYQRLQDMIERGAAGDRDYADNNKHVLPYLATDGRLYLVNRRNEAFADALTSELSDDALPGIKVDKITYALYPPTSSLQRSLIAEALIGYLAKSVGHENISEVLPWPSEDAELSQHCRSLHEISLGEIEEAISDLGGHYVDDLVERFHVSLNYLDNKHFVILTGLSGTGKTTLARYYSRAVHGITSPYDDDPFLFICPVRSDWTDPAGLTGYYDVISNRYIVPKFLEAVIIATSHSQCPVFVCLDEMNLARVEYYFSDVLSSMESGSPLTLHSSSTPLEASNGGTIPPRLFLPSNLYIVGTINIDETTQPISDKVLDRAVVIDMSSVDLEGFFETLLSNEPELSDSINDCSDVLLGVQRELQPEGLGFGYRIAEEFIRYHNFATEAGTKTSVEIIDHLLVQKVLVKLRGTEKQHQMLFALSTILSDYERAKATVDRLINELDELGSFQNVR